MCVCVCACVAISFRSVFFYLHQSVFLTGFLLADGGGCSLLITALCTAKP